MEWDIVWGRTMFRNKEFTRFTVIYFVLSTLFLFLSFGINRAAGIVMFLAVFGFGIAFLIFTKIRYQKIAQISEQIDDMLHEEQFVNFSDASEGELAILQNEISKMMLRIKEQNEALKKEKEYLSDSLADIAHQLRTPLTSLQLLQTLLEKTSEQSERKAFLWEMKELLLKMDWLISTLLKISKLDAKIVLFQKESIDLVKLMEAALLPFSIQMELHQITLELNIVEKQKEHIFIQGDFAWLVEAIQNIIKNCMESIKENGAIKVNIVDNPLYIEICIQDNGPGFQTKDLPYIFDRFYRGENQSSSGYGIGLALSKMIIKGHGGTILAKNHPVEGALFTIRFQK